LCETQPISPETLAGADLSGVGLTGARQQAVQAFSRAVADDSVRLDRSVGIDDLVSSITALPGLGPWTAQNIALPLGEPESFSRRRPREPPHPRGAPRRIACRQQTAVEIAGDDPPVGGRDDPGRRVARTHERMCRDHTCRRP
jgi:hypothetical protein